MVDVTTVKVRAATRDRLREANPDMSADESINRALDALDHHRLAREMSEDARRLSDDPAYLAEIANLRDYLATPLDQLAEDAG